MLASNYTQEILNLQDVIVEKVENLNKKGLFVNSWGEKRTIYL